MNFSHAKFTSKTQLSWEFFFRLTLTVNTIYFSRNLQTSVKTNSDTEEMVQFLVAYKSYEISDSGKSGNINIYNYSVTLGFHTGIHRSTTLISLFPNKCSINALGIQVKRF